MTPSTRSARSGRALYRALLVLAPPRLRREHGGRDGGALRRAPRRRARRGAAPPPRRCGCRAAADLLQARVHSRRPDRVPLTVYIDERTAIMAGSDLRYAWRALLRQRGASALVVLMLALGIAAQRRGLQPRQRPLPAAVPVPRPRSARLPQHRRAEVEPRRRRHQLSRLRSLAEGSEAVRGDHVLRHRELQPRRTARAPRACAAPPITYDFTKVLGVEPLLGRTFTRRRRSSPRARRSSAQRRALARALRRRSATCIGRTLRLDGTARTIVGVMPAEASFPEDVQLWVPMARRSRAAVPELFRRRHRPAEARRDDRAGRGRPDARAPADLGRAATRSTSSRRSSRPLRETFVARLPHGAARAHGRRRGGCCCSSPARTSRR